MSRHALNPEHYTSQATFELERERLFGRLWTFVGFASMVAEKNRFFTRKVAGWMIGNYDGVLKIDGEVGNKKLYDPRAWGKVAETAMAARVVESTRQLGSYGQSKS